jgi:hypothetical protein
MGQTHIATHLVAYDITTGNDWTRRLSRWRFLSEPKSGPEMMHGSTVPPTERAADTVDVCIKKIL